MIVVVLLATLACQDRSASVSLEEASRLVSEGNRAEGLAMLRTLLAEDPDDPRLLYAYGRALGLDGQISAARWPLSRAMEDADWTVRAGMLAARGAYSIHGYEDAIAITSRILEAHPDHVPALLLRAEAGLDARLDYEQPLADAVRVLDLAPDDEHALRLRIVALLNLERVEEARVLMDDLAERLRSQGEDDPSALAELCGIQGTFLFESGAVDELRPHWERCLEEFPAHPRVLDPAVEFYDVAGEPTRSIEILERAVEEEPGSPVPLDALAVRLEAAGRAADAEQRLLDTTEDHPAVGWDLLASHYRRVGNHLARAEALDRLAETLPSPEPGGLRFDRADAWLLAGDLDRAEEIASALDVAAQRTLVLGRIALERGDPREALDLFAETTRIWPDQTFARYYAAFAAELLGDFDRAIEEYRHAIRSGSDMTDARFRLAQIHAAQGKDLTAIETLSVAGGDSSLDARKLLLKLFGRMRRIDAIRLQMSSAWSVPGTRAELFEQAVLGIAESAGNKAAIQVVETIPIDLKDPRDAILLRRFVGLLLAAGEAETAAERAQAALQASPSSPDLNEIAGLVVEHGAPDAQRARAHFERALELDANHTRSLLGLARLDLAEERRSIALERLNRAVESAGDDRDLLLSCARLLIEAAERSEAERILEDLARREPSDARATMLLARLRFDRGLSDDWTAQLARSAVRLGGGSAARTLLSEIRAARGEATGTDAFSGAAERPLHASRAGRSVRASAWEGRA